MAPDLSAAERVTGAEIPGVLPREPRSRHRAGGTPSIRLVMPPASFGAWWSPILGQHFGRLSRPSEGGLRPLRNRDSSGLNRTATHNPIPVLSVPRPPTLLRGGRRPKRTGIARGFLQGEENPDGPPYRAASR